ncbi:unnamed protein product, partial [Laminaria digitata]
PGGASSLLQRGRQHARRHCGGASRERLVEASSGRGWRGRVPGGCREVELPPFLGLAVRTTPRSRRLPVGFPIFDRSKPQPDVPVRT